MVEICCSLGFCGLLIMGWLCLPPGLEKAVVVYTGLGLHVDATFEVMGPQPNASPIGSS